MPLESIYLNGGFIGSTVGFEERSETITCAYNGVFHQNVPGATSMSISGVSTGNITADDWLVVAVCIEMNRSTYTNGWVTSLTVNGSAVTIIAQSPINENLTAAQTHTVIGYITGITASTVTVVVGYADGGTQFRGSVASYKLTSSGTIEVLDSDYDYSNSTGTKTLTTDVYENGVVIYQAMFADETTTDSWTGLTTENYNIAHPENNASLSGGIYSSSFTGIRNVNVTIDVAGAENALVAASFKSTRTVNRSYIFNLQAVFDSLAPPNIVTDGLVLALDAGDPRSYPGTGTTWFDTSGNVRNATINGSPTFTNYYFDITSDSTYMSLSNSGLVPRTNDFTYSVWLNFDTTDTFDTIFENGSWTDTLLFRRQNTSDIRVYAEGALRGTFTWTPVTGSWFNFVLIRESGTVSLYINNVLTGTPFTMTTDINLSNTNLWLMRSQHTSNQFIDGKISTFSIYNKALSTSEIEQNYNALKGRFGL